MSLPEEHVKVALHRTGVLLVTLNRPDKLNCLSEQMLDGFAAAMAEATANPAVRAVAVTGAGRGFCAGAELGTSDDAESHHVSPPSTEYIAGVNIIDRLHSRLAHAAWLCPKPTVGLINGPAAGAGMGLALACDFRTAGASALFVSAFSRIALSGDSGITYALSHIVGRSKAMEVLALSPRIDATRALELGLVSDVVPDDELLTHGLEFAERLAKLPGTAYALMKRNLAFAETATYHESLDREAASIVSAQSSDEFRRGVQAFLNGRS